MAVTYRYIPLHTVTYLGIHGRAHEAHVQWQLARQREQSAQREHQEVAFDGAFVHLGGRCARRLTGLQQAALPRPSSGSDTQSSVSDQNEVIKQLSDNLTQIRAKEMVWYRSSKQTNKAIPWSSVEMQLPF